jgi:hypothetical protein
MWLPPLSNTLTFRFVSEVEQELYLRYLSRGSVVRKLVSKDMDGRDMLETETPVTRPVMKKEVCDYRAYWRA